MVVNSVMKKCRVLIFKVQDVLFKKQFKKKSQ